MNSPLLVPGDEDIREVALRLSSQFEGLVPRALVTRAVWRACRDLDHEVPRAALAEFTHRLAGQRLAAAIERRRLL